MGSLVGMNEQKRDVCRALRECLTPRFALTNKVKPLLKPLFSHLLHNPLMSEPFILSDMPAALQAGMKLSLYSLSFGSLFTSSPSSHYYPDLYSLLIFPLCLSRVVLHLFFSFYLFLCVV